MKELPLAVAISAVIKNNKILLIKRLKDPYAGFWGLPGGKIEKHEHVSDAAIREILEESGINTEFKGQLGFVSEHLKENGKVDQHFLLHVCELRPKTTKTKDGGEGELDWFDLGTIQTIKNKTIPSDYLIIEKIIKNREKNYYNCVVHKEKGGYVLKNFV